MHIVYDGRLGKYEVPKAARCPKCRARVGEANADHASQPPVITCRCGHRWIISFEHPAMFQHLRATNDANGNPRRAFAFYASDGRLIDVRDEGYRGRPILCRGLIELPSVEVAPGEYREWIRSGEELTGHREAK